MNPKHTPGPWRIEWPTRGFNGFIIHGPDVDSAEMVSLRKSGDDYRATDEKQEANARLIAASPDLLEAAQGLLTALESRFARTGANAQEEVAIKKLRNTIAKVLEV
jgi:uncharacterized protein YgbK (DUF1537 family)